MKWILCLLVSLAPACAAELRAGAAQVVITPPPGAPMAGYYYNRGADGVHDDLHAKALVFEKDGVKAALVACDLSAVPRSIVEKARGYIRSQTGIPPENVMISATHTHTGPVLLADRTRYNLQGEMRRIGEEYTAGLPAKIAEAVRLADAAMQPARVRSGVGQEDSLTFNRRFHMKDGTVGWNPGKLNPNIVRPAGPTDGSVPVVFIEDAKGRGIAAWVNYALHLDTVGGTRYSADYPATLSHALQAAFGDGFVTVFTIGCAGNLNHIDVSTKTPQKGHTEAARIGAVLAGETLKTIKRSAAVEVPRIRSASEIVRLDVPKFTADEVAKAQAVSATFGQKDAAPFLDLVHAGKVNDVAQRDFQPMEAEVQTIAVGPLAFVALPGEIFVEHGLTIKNGSPFPFTAIAELANGSVGYVPDRKAYAQGAYEVVSARVVEGSGEKLAETAIRQLVSLYK
jgi:neutral ceramidase